MAPLPTGGEAGVFGDFSDNPWEVLANSPTPGLLGTSDAAAKARALKLSTLTKAHAGVSKSSEFESCGRDH